MHRICYNPDSDAGGQYISGNLDFYVFEELIEQYNKELREIYGRVMQNEHMAAYQAAKNEFDALMQRVTGVLSMCAEGQDPDGCDPDACGCTGSCATCGGGCH